jgi:mRNA-degrading endonuclease RelE of RelBE toxin-antitoxin system
MTSVRPTTRFENAFKGLSHEVQKAVMKALLKLIDNPSHPGLNLESLRGAPGYYSIRANRGFRIILLQADPTTFDLIDVGPHDIYRRY